MGDIEKGQALTPEKKSQIIQQIVNELAALNKAIKDKTLDKEVLKKIEDNKRKLQDLLNKLLKKVGVITPQETDEVLSSLDESKKARLEKSYKRSMTKTTLILVSFIAVAGVLVYLTKRNKG